MMGFIMGKRGIISLAVAAVVVVAFVLVAVAVFLAPRQGEQGRPVGVAPRARVTEAVFAPLPAAAASNAGPGIIGLVDPAWVAKTADKTGIPAVALRAYAAASLDIAANNPKCGISWNTLAGVGWVESHHGTIHGSDLGANGTVTPPLYGVALDGNGFALIPDSDGGAIDGDPKGDRAVGPMQFLPNSWRNWHVDADGDGVENPQNIYDATFAAAHYLCRAGGELQTQDGFRTAVLAYNSSHAYLQDVMDAAADYARRAR
jgi:membrane-bound lytic murein transglycosylase B